MKDTGIHNNLEQKELRNFFSEMIYNSNFSQREKPIKKFNSDKNDPYGNTIRNLKIDVDELNFQIKEAENLRSIFILLNQQGWKEFDCSDHVSRTSDFYRSFIGTEKEFNEFIKNIENE